MTKTIKHQFFFPHPPEKIWDYLTNSELLELWLMKNDFQPIVGHRFNFRAPPMPNWNGVTDCVVLTVDPDRELSYTWNASGEEAAKGIKTVVTWTLTPTATGVLLRMEHSGFRPQDEGNIKGATYGWQKFVGGLERVLAGLP